MLQSVGSQRIGHNWGTEHQQQRIVHPQGVRVGWLQRSGLNHLGSLFLCFLSPSPPLLHPIACPMHIKARTPAHHPSERRHVCFFFLFFFTWGSHSGPGIFPLFPFHGLFPFLCLSFSSCHFGLLFLFCLPNIPPSRDGRPNSLGIGALRSLWPLPILPGYFWAGMVRGIGPPPLASLKPQNLYSSVSLRVYLF